MRKFRIRFWRKKAHIQIIPEYVMFPRIFGVLDPVDTLLVIALIALICMKIAGVL